MPRPPPPAVALMMTGKPIACGDADRRLEIRHAAVRPRHHRNPQRLGGFLGGDLVAHDADMFRRGADEGDAVVFQRLREGGVFGQEAIARMHRLRAR